MLLDHRLVVDGRFLVRRLGCWREWSVVAGDMAFGLEGGGLRCAYPPFGCCFVLTIATRWEYPFGMNSQPLLAEVNIHLRARAQDRNIIDQAAELVGANRSQFMMASALKEAKAVLLDQTTIYTDIKTFNAVMDWMDAAPTGAEAAGMARLQLVKAPWRRE